jgi:spore coat polysaccharide biosynthesis protein SpsF (cytidylyltransferase family)
MKMLPRSNLLIVQARMNSTRLPGKVLELLEESPLIDYQLQRIGKSKLVQRVVVATSQEKSDDLLAEHLERNSHAFVRGSLNNVFDRFIDVLNIYEPDFFIRITGDCPLVMPEILDSMIEVFEKSDLDYLSNALEPSFPDGLDVEIVKTSALRNLSTMKLSATEKEHVTLGIYSRPNIFSIQNYSNETDLSKERWTVDYPQDLEFVRRIVQFEKKQFGFLTLSGVVNFLRSNPEQGNTLSGNLRNEALKDWEPQHG